MSSLVLFDAVSQSIVEAYPSVCASTVAAGGLDVPHGALDV